MESNADKLMREKLNSAEFTFDPQAWTQMEAMLDQKKKRRAIFWWWFGGAGMAAALIGWLLWNSHLNAVPESNTTTAAQTFAASTTSGRTASEESSMSSAIFSYTGKKANTTLSTPTQHTPAYKGGNTAVTPIVAGYEQIAASVVEQIVAPNNSTYSPITISNNLKESEANDLPASEAEQLISTTLDSANNELPVASEETAVDLPVKSKNKFAYSIGLLTGVSGTSVGKQDVANNVGSTPFFYRQPSFAIGFSNDFLFVDRVALTTGLLYAQTSLRIEKPKYTVTDSVGTIRNFKTEIRELQIPLMVKGYFFRSKAVSLFASVGVINHIKLKEKFTVEYEVPIALNSTPPIATATDVQTIEQYNSFTPGVENTTANFNESKSSTSGESFGMGGTKRYYASVYTSLGVELSLAKQFLLSAEPMYFFSAKKIGEQPQRKHNLGLNVGIRYLFGVR